MMRPRLTFARRRRFGLVAILAVAASAGIALSGCAISPSIVATPQPTVAVTSTATPTPAANTADTPIDALAAWAMCKGFGFGTVGLLPYTNVYDVKNIAEANGEFTVQLLGEVGDRSETAEWCTISGTLGDPKTKYHLIRAEPSNLTPSAPFTIPAPAPNVRTAGTPIDALTAWAMCKGFERGIGEGSYAPHLTHSYDPKFIMNANGAFTVQLAGAPGEKSSDSAWCTISGSLGDPHTDFTLFY